MQFTATVEKENEFKQLKCEDAYLTEIGWGIAHTVTCREPGFSVQHSNLIIEVDKMITENIPNVIELGNEKFYNFLYEIDGEIWLIRIRKLTPKECWRLMGFYDEDFEKAEKVNSNTQLYKQAGNSIVVNVLEAIFKQLIGD